MLGSGDDSELVRVTGSQVWWAVMNLVVLTSGLVYFLVVEQWRVAALLLSLWLLTAGPVLWPTVRVDVDHIVVTNLRRQRYARDEVVAVALKRKVGAMGNVAMLCLRTGERKSAWVVQNFWGSFDVGHLEVVDRVQHLADVLRVPVETEHS